MSKPVLLSGGNGKVLELAGTNDNDVLTWDSATSAWVSAAGGGGGGSGTVTSVGLTGGTSGIVIGGAVSPITNAGTYNLDAPQRFAFDTTSPIAPTAAGQISWNATEGSLNTLMIGNNVDAVIGQQLYQRVVNNDTVPLTKGMVVYVDGSSGTRVTVQRATASADLTSATIIGVVAETIAVNAAGFIITEGALKDLNVLPATTFTDGDVVYLSPTTAGGLTPTKPTAPQHLVMVGYCVKASNGSAGVLLVKTQNGYELGELHDVYINSPISGQILIYDGATGQTRWENASLGGSNGVAVTQGAGSLSVGLNSASSPTLTGLTLSGLSNGLIRATTGVLAGGATVTGSDFSSQSPNTVFAAPDVTSGNPTFRPLVANDIPSLSAIYLPLSGGTLTGKLVTPALTTSTAGFNIAPTAATPTTLVNGDVWTTVTGLFAHINGATQQYGALSVTNTWTSSNTFSASTVSFGTSGNTGTVSLGTGPTINGSTKTVNIGTGGLAGSTTTITIGATAGTSTTTLNGTVSATTQTAGNNTTALATTAFVTTAVATASGGPYDFGTYIPGSPVASTTLASWSQVRAFTVSGTAGNQYIYADTAPTTSAVTATLYKLPSGSSTPVKLFDVTWTAGQAAGANGKRRGTLSNIGDSTARNIAAGDVIYFATGSTVDSGLTNISVGIYGNL